MLCRRPHAQAALVAAFEHLLQPTVESAASRPRAVAAVQLAAIQNERGIWALPRGDAIGLGAFDLPLSELELRGCAWRKGSRVAQRKLVRRTFGAAGLSGASPPAAEAAWKSRETKSMQTWSTVTT
jgi:hypothetical protein